jgi:hypothetical protein
VLIHWTLPEPRRSEDERGASRASSPDAPFALRAGRPEGTFLTNVPGELLEEFLKRGVHGPLSLGLLPPYRWASCPPIAGPLALLSLEQHLARESS